jgi:diguanylate cyclase (GGDEF)-like protein/PAS domain S-box-containing protein
MVNEKLDQLISSLFEGVYIVNTKRKILFWNSGCESITGYKSEEVVNSFCYDNILQHVDAEGNQLCFGGCPLHYTLDTGEKAERDVFLRHKKGHRVPITVRSLPLYDENNKIVGAIEVFNDNRFRKQLYDQNRELQKLVSHDELTQVYNRRYLKFQMDSLIREYLEFKVSFGVLFLDIDDFKKVNDTYGHNVGDDVLRMVSRTLKSNIRPNDIVGRWGGEEFLILLRNVNQLTLVKVAEKIRVLVEHSKMDSNTDFSHVTVSIGATLYHDGETSEEFIDRADKLMYLAKQRGKNICIFDNKEIMK